MRQRFIATQAVQRGVQGDVQRMHQRDGRHGISDIVLPDQGDLGQCDDLLEFQCHHPLIIDDIDTKPMEVTGACGEFNHF